MSEIKWEWQETLSHQGTEAEMKAAHKAFTSKKNAVHFVVGHAPKKDKPEPKKGKQS